MLRKNIISGQFILSAGAFIAVMVSFISAVLIAGEGRFVLVILLFLAFFTALFVPVSLFAHPLIERDAVKKYLDGMEQKVRVLSFKEQDLADMKQLKTHLLAKTGRGFKNMAARTAIMLAEMERLEKVRSSFYWDEREGMVH